MNLGTRLTKAGALAHLKTLDDVVDDYLKRFDFHASNERSEGHHDPVIDYCKEAGTLPQVINRACDGRRRDGKMWAGGSCVRTSSKQELAKILLREIDLISRAAGNFDDLYDVIKLRAPWGISSYTVYNVTARICAWYGIYPKNNVYLHVGPMRGWKKLMGSRSNPGYRIPVKELPKPFQRLPPHKVEDLLCEYQDLLHPGML